MAINTTYNGWTNKATWLVKLWMDNDQSSYFYWLDQAINTANCYQLADEIEHFHLDIAPENIGLFTDLLSTALSEVNWFEIAKSLLNDLSDY